MPKLRQTYGGRLICKTSHDYRKINLRQNSLKSYNQQLTCLVIRRKLRNFDCFFSAAVFALNYSASATPVLTASFPGRPGKPATEGKTSLDVNKPRLVLPFWYRLTQVVLERGC